MDRDKVKIILKEAISKAFEKDELENKRNGYIGENTISFMAEASLSVLLAIEDVHRYMQEEGIIKD